MGDCTLNDEDDVDGLLCDWVCMYAEEETSPSARRGDHAPMEVVVVVVVVGDDGDGDDGSRGEEGYWGSISWLKSCVVQSTGALIRLVVVVVLMPPLGGPPPPP